jgi:ribosomal protein S18 acetylase RimI-like enzyme
VTAVSVRLAGDADRAALVALFQELDRFYAKDRPVAPAAVTAERIERHLFGDHPTEIALAEVGGEPVGLASFGMLFPGPGLSGHLQLKDLFVRDGARGLGAGEALVRFLARLVQQRGGSRLDWTTESWNEGAQRLYDRLGAARQLQKVYYRLEGDAFQRLVKADD